MHLSIVNKPSCTVGKPILTGQLLVSFHPVGVICDEYGVGMLYVS